MKLFRRQVDEDAAQAQPATGEHDGVPPTVIRGHVSKPDNDPTSPIATPDYQLPMAARLDLEVRARILASALMLPDKVSQAAAFNWAIKHLGLNVSAQEFDE